MKILALEFSSDWRSVAVVRSDPPSQTKVLASVHQAEGQATHAFALIDQAVRQAELDPADIDAIAVGLGPGSYTGIRLSLSIAQGWQAARSVQAIGVGSVDCLVAQAQAEGWSGLVHFAIDAHRNEFYHAAYAIDPDHAQLATPLEIIPQQDLARLQDGASILAGPDIQKWAFHGRPLVPAAAMIGLIASRNQHLVDAHRLEPIYLRSPSFVKAAPP